MPRDSEIPHRPDTKIGDFILLSESSPVPALSIGLKTIAESYHSRPEAVELAAPASYTNQRQQAMGSQYPFPLSVTPPSKGLAPPRPYGLVHKSSASSLRGMEQGLCPVMPTPLPPETPMSAVSPLSSPPAVGTPQSSRSTATPSSPRQRCNHSTTDGYAPDGPWRSRTNGSARAPIGTPRPAPPTPGFVVSPLLTARGAPVTEGRRMAVDLDKPLPVPGPVDLEAEPLIYEPDRHLSTIAKLGSPTRRSSVYDWAGIEEKQAVVDNDLMSSGSQDSLTSPRGGEIPIHFGNLISSGIRNSSSAAKSSIQDGNQTQGELPELPALASPRVLYLQPTVYSGSAISLAKDIARQLDGHPDTEEVLAKDETASEISKATIRARNPELVIPTLTELVSQSRILDDFNRNSVLVSTRDATALQLPSSPTKAVQATKLQQAPPVSEELENEASQRKSEASINLPPVFYDSSEDGSREEFPLRPAPLRVGGLQMSALTIPEDDQSEAVDSRPISRFSDETEDSETRDIVPKPPGLRRKRSLIAEILRRSVKTEEAAPGSETSSTRIRSLNTEPWRFQKNPEYWGADPSSGTIPSHGKMSIKKKVAVRAKQAAKGFKEGMVKLGDNMEREELDPLVLKPVKVDEIVQKIGMAKDAVGKAGETVMAWPMNSEEQEIRQAEARRQKLKGMIQVVRENTTGVTDNKWM